MDGSPVSPSFSMLDPTAVTGRGLMLISAASDRWGVDPLPQYGSTQFAHVGFTTKLPWYLRLGTTTHLLDRWRASDVLDLVARERIATIGGVAPQVALRMGTREAYQMDPRRAPRVILQGVHHPSHPCSRHVS